MPPPGAAAPRPHRGGEAAETLHPLRPLELLDLEPGAFRILRGEAARCIQFPETGEAGAWLMGIQSVITLPEARDAVVLEGRPSEGVQAPFGTPFALAAWDRGLRESWVERGHAGVGVPGGEGPPPTGPRRRPPDALGSARCPPGPGARPGHGAPCPRRDGRLRSGRPVPSFGLGPGGDTVPIRIPPFSGNCGQFTPRTVVVREKTARAIVVEDVLNP